MIEIDGFAVLAAIARHRDVFSAARPDVVKTAKSFVGKQLKDKTLTLGALRAVAEAIGVESFDLIIDGLSEAETKSLLAKVDKLNTPIKTASPQDQREQIAGLARGTVQPSEKIAAAKPAKVPKAPKAPVERADNSKAMRARKRT